MRQSDRDNLDMFCPHFLVQNDAKLMLRIPYQMKEAAPMPQNAVLLGGIYWNYFHWLLETISALAVVDRAPGGIAGHFYVLTQGHLTKWQREILRLLGIDADRIILAGEHAQRFRSIIVASMLSREHVVHPEAVEFVRRRMLPAIAGASPRKGHRRLFVTRRVKGRVVTNLAGIEQRLRQLGFEVIDPGAMSVLDQLRAFNEASVVVGLGGAAMTNLAFCPTTVKVVLVGPDGGWGETFTSITAALGAETWVVPTDMFARDPNKHYLWTIADCDISEEVLMQAVNQALKAAAFVQAPAEPKSTTAPRPVQSAEQGAEIS
jgi:capsular polysaccharide biosynthesis protein